CAKVGYYSGSPPLDYW
nr:immunoglobulin heavy chain junction region [Macaca mulatta]MOW23732.1 immunoglobulin heavy chain junction region [Macaca mulatta]MOW23951.1 immunoglobulin heavy chain junction region [Macaca mulatta]MOW24137.1 immunoglobulin heavy chain junction region [Macaca mulatta]MOW24177.1 immunoglobulin heavy chain junction region [Macaca mulatta]